MEITQLLSPHSFWHLPGIAGVPPPIKTGVVFATFPALIVFEFVADPGGA